MLLFFFFPIPIPFLDFVITSCERVARCPDVGLGICILFLCIFQVSRGRVIIFILNSFYFFMCPEVGLEVSRGWIIIFSLRRSEVGLEVSRGWIGVSRGLPGCKEARGRYNSDLVRTFSEVGPPWPWPDIS